MMVLLLLLLLSVSIATPEEVPALIRQDFHTDNATEAVIMTTIPDDIIDHPFSEPSNIIKDPELAWVSLALKDIAYYLRNHKFNEYDRRYVTKENKEYFSAFPRPPLRSLHWEVHRFCEASFLSCVEFLWKKVKKAGIRREDDTNVIIIEQNWSSNYSAQIEAVDQECKKMLTVDDSRADPFEGPIERFQWRTTASYYMCWYTMKEVPNLMHLEENCDNFAACSSPGFGPKNNDPRADDSVKFACSKYSFCPDPCCPLKHLHNMAECWENPLNPCSFNKNDNYCSLNHTKNGIFPDIILNRWNVSCKCPIKGYEWDSRFGICVDVDECLEDVHDCEVGREACVNLPGSYKCSCLWGFKWKEDRCEESPALKVIKLHRKKKKNETETKLASSLVKRLYNMLFNRNSCGKVGLPSMVITFLSCSVKFGVCSL